MQGPQKKALLMGRAKAGKTSMKSVVFADCEPVSTQCFSATHNIDHRSVPLFGEIEFSLWDCGGQDIYLNSYLESGRNFVFQNAALLIFVIEFRVKEAEALLAGNRSKCSELFADLVYLTQTLDALYQASPSAEVFILIHKTDLLPLHRLSPTIAAYCDVIQAETRPHHIATDRILGSSIWNESLYEAWSRIVRSLIPRVDEMEDNLSKLATVINADDLILLEKATFLRIAHTKQRIVRNDRLDREESMLTPIAFERLSNVIKQFRISCLKGGGQFQTVNVNLAASSIFIERFTENLFIVVAFPRRDIPLGAVMLNLDLASPFFERFEKALAPATSTSTME